MTVRAGLTHSPQHPSISIGFGAATACVKQHAA
jgi:hypothetical protein